MVWCGGAPFSYNWEGTTLIADPQFWMFLDTILLIMIQSVRHDSVIQGWSSPFHLFTLPDKPPTNCLFSELLIMLDFLGGPLRAAAFTTIHVGPPLRPCDIEASQQVSSTLSRIFKPIGTHLSLPRRSRHAIHVSENTMPLYGGNIHLFKEKHINLDVDTLWISESTTYRQGQQQTMKTSLMHTLPYLHIIKRKVMVPICRRIHLQKTTVSSCLFHRKN